MTIISENVLEWGLTCYYIAGRKQSGLETYISSFWSYKYYI